MSVSRGTVHSIQFLRFVAATLVVLFHAHLGIVTRLTRDASALERYLFEFGAVGVHIFFVISGYIMYLTNFGRTDAFSPGAFLGRRLIRIYPVYWVFVAIYLLVESGLGIMPLLPLQQFVGMLVLWPGDAPRVIGPAWTLSFEMFFYLAFGLVMIAGARRGVWLLTGTFLLLVAVGAIVRPAAGLAQLATSSLLLEFVAGVWIARITTAHVLSRAAAWMLTALALGGFGAALAVGYDRYPTALTLGLPSIALIAGAVALERSSRETHPWLVRLSVLGDSSYALYLCHILLVTLALVVFRTTGVIGGRLGATLLVTLVAIAAAHVFHLWIERPLTRVLHRRLSGQRAPSQQKREAQDARGDGAGPRGREQAG